MGTEKNSSKRKNNKNKFNYLGKNFTNAGDENFLKRNTTDLGNKESDIKRVAKQRKQKLFSENKEVNSLSKHKHRHKLLNSSEQDVKTTTSASLANTSYNKKDWVSSLTKKSSSSIIFMTSAYLSLSGHSLQHKTAHYRVSKKM